MFGLVWGLEVKKQTGFCAGIQFSCYQQLKVNSSEGRQKCNVIMFHVKMIKTCSWPWCQFTVEEVLVMVIHAFLKSLLNIVTGGSVSQLFHPLLKEKKVCTALGSTKVSCTLIIHLYSKRRRACSAAGDTVLKLKQATLFFLDSRGFLLPTLPAVRESLGCRLMCVYPRCFHTRLRLWR